MAARGSLVKQEISKKIIEIFPNSFLYNDGKEIRINTTEEGQPVQIKVVLTAAKTPVGQNNMDDMFNSNDSVETSAFVQEQTPQEVTEEEKKRLTQLLEQLGL